jgi:hypothetical protein
MDEGDLDFDQGLKEASESREAGGRKERKERERSEEAEPEPN